MIRDPLKWIAPLFLVFLYSVHGVVLHAADPPSDSPPIPAPADPETAALRVRAKITSGFDSLASALGRFAFLTEQSAYLNEVLRRKHFLSGGDELAQRMTLCKAALAGHRRKGQAIFQSFIALGHEPSGEALSSFQAGLTGALADLQAFWDVQQKWAAKNELPLPQAPAPLSMRLGVRDALRFGARIHDFEGKGFERRSAAWRSLGLDFVGISLDVFPKDNVDASRLDLAGIKALIQKNRQGGCRFLVSAQGRNPLDVCLWDAEARKQWQWRCRLLGTTFKNVPAVLAYRLLEDPSPRAWVMERGPDGEKARRALRTFLESHYDTIGALNDAWETAYPDFDAIDTPPLKRGLHPVKRDMARFYRQSLAAFVEGCTAALKKADPAHAVGLQLPVWRDSFSVAPPAVKDGEGQPGCSVLSAAINRDMWLALAGGTRGMVFDGFDGAVPEGRCPLLDATGPCAVIRPESGRIPVVIGMARRIESLLLDTQPGDAEIGIVDAAASRLSGKNAARQQLAQQVMTDFLDREGWSYRFLPDEQVAASPSMLKNLLAVVLPDNVAMNSRAAERLEAYSAAGGLLVGMGRGGYLDGAGLPTKLSKLLLARKRRLGRGYVFCVGSVKEDLGAFGEFLAAAFTRPRVRVTPAGSAAAFYRTDGRRHFLFLVNRSAVAEEICNVSTTLTFGIAEDSLAGAVVPVKVERFRQPAGNARSPGPAGRSAPGVVRHMTVRLAPGGFALLTLKK